MIHKIKSIHKMVQQDAVLPDGIYTGIWSGYIIRITLTLKYNKEEFILMTEEDIRGTIKVNVFVEGGVSTFNVIRRISETAEHSSVENLVKVNFSDWISIHDAVPPLNKFVAVLSNYNKIDFGRIIKVSMSRNTNPGTSVDYQWSLVDGSSYIVEYWMPLPSNYKNKT